MALKIYYSYQNNEAMKAVNPKITLGEMAQVDTWVGELEANNNTLTAKTKYALEKSTGETLKEVGTYLGLRIDLQKVIGVGKKEEAATYVFVNSKKPATQEQYLAFQAKPKSAKVMEVPGKLTYEALWSLFAVQKAKTYNRVFHLNNLIDTLTTAQWKKVFELTLQNCFTAIVTNDKNKIPSGYDVGNLVEESE